MERCNISSCGDCDLISSMPDPILHHILGFLKTKEAVQTCVMSKRWQHLWTSLASLDFDAQDFTALEDPKYDSEEEESNDPERAHDSERFATFVDMVLLRRKPVPLDVFRMSFGALDSNYVTFQNWLNYAVQHNPRVVHLDYFCCSLPVCVYTCTSLEELYIHLYPVQILTLTRRPVVNLPNLKRLSIRNDFLTPNQFKDLLFGCPILEYLWLNRCYFGEETEIAHESLQHLTIVDSKISFFHASNLLTFYYISSEATATLDMPSLTYAHLELKNPMIQYPLVQCWNGLASFLRGLVNVEVLELCVPWAQLLEEFVLPELPVYQKMHDLSVGAFCMRLGFFLVTWILWKVPNLKKLTILQQSECTGFCCGEEADTSESTDVPLRAAISYCKNLEFVEVKYSRFDSMLKQLIDALVEGTKELQNVNIILSKH
ncbi:hypothetical protein LUZ61_016461 [Rhynchospora tenuis]|uniref:F-box domain-containing protein n=1 Tax=Rhynchospora tenuis TaxID=198213 RepID=A0AAD5Z5J6_9POAL|nr:hypothetical protein LUZ61_016461 [Rhynchospora tenuis]